MILLNDAIKGQKYTIINKWEGAIIEINGNGDAVLLKQGEEGLPWEGYIGTVCWTKFRYGSSLQLEPCEEEDNSVLMVNAPDGLYKVSGYTDKTFLNDKWKGAIVFRTSKGAYLIKQSPDGCQTNHLLNHIAFRMDRYGSSLKLIPHKL